MSILHDIGEELNTPTQEESLIDFTSQHTSTNTLVPQYDEANVFKQSGAPGILNNIFIPQMKFNNSNSISNSAIISDNDNQISSNINMAATTIEKYFDVQVWSPLNSPSDVVYDDNSSSAISPFMEEWSIPSPLKPDTEFTEQSYTFQNVNQTDMPNILFANNFIKNDIMLCSTNVQNNKLPVELCAVRRVDSELANHYHNIQSNLEKAVNIIPTPTSSPTSVHVSLKESSINKKVVLQTTSEHSYVKHLPITTDHICETDANEEEVEEHEDTHVEDLISVNDKNFNNIDNKRKHILVKEQFLTTLNKHKDMDNLRVIIPQSVENASTISHIYNNAVDISTPEITDQILEMQGLGPFLPAVSKSAHKLINIANNIPLNNSRSVQYPTSAMMTIKKEPCQDPLIPIIPTISLGCKRSSNKSLDDFLKSISTPVSKRSRPNSVASFDYDAPGSVQSTMSNSDCDSLSGKSTAITRRRGRPPKAHSDPKLEAQKYSHLPETDRRYIEMRNKNNEASRRSRINRKSKEIKASTILQQLESRNAALLEDEVTLTNEKRRWKRLLMRVALM